MDLSRKQIKYLKGLGHHLKPVVMIGKGGLTENVMLEFERTLECHELVKVKVDVHEKEELLPILKKMEERLSCTRVGTIGKTALFYLGNDKPLKNARDSRIKLPLI